MAPRRIVLTAIVVIFAVTSVEHTADCLPAFEQADVGRNRRLGHLQTLGHVVQPGGDRIRERRDVEAAVRLRRGRSEGPRGVEAGGTLESLPDNAATEATVVEGADA